MTPTLDSLHQEIQSIKARNTKVESDKARETSLTRKLSIAGLTYIVIVLFFFAAGFSKPFLNAIVPTTGFLLSTLSLDLFKKLWIQKYIRK